MEWQKVFESLTASGPLAGCLAFALWTLWKKLEVEQAKNDQLQKDQSDFLKTLLPRNSDD